MFTGIIYGIGVVLGIKKSNSQLLIRIQPSFKTDDFKLGESIAVNGCCLTVLRFSQSWFEVYVSVETFTCTNLTNLKIKKLVNLERALKLNERLGGHIVTGHIDEVAPIKKIQAVGQSKMITLVIGKKNSGFLLEKGSIALDGISLTIVSHDRQLCKVNLIPETLNSTTAATWRLGQKINIEIDSLAKLANSTIKQSHLSKNFLCEHGFL